MRALAIAVCLYACSSHDVAPAPAPMREPAVAAVPDAAPADAAAPAISTIPARPVHEGQCEYLGPKEFIDVKIDVATGRGEVERVTTTEAVTRHLHVVATTAGKLTTLTFAGYFPDDYTFMGKPRRRDEKLAKTSVVARLDTSVAGEQRLFVDGDVDLAGGMKVPPSAGYYVCTR